MKRSVIICFLVISLTTLAQQPLSERLCQTVMNTWKDSFSLNGRASKWSYDMGVVLKGFENAWQQTGDVKYFNYIQQQMEYFVNEDGSIKVVNRGYDAAKNKWKESVGKAKFVGKDDVGMLKVSFFGPFYAGYNVIALDSNYQYALVAGEKLSYLWILSRQKTIPESIKKEYLQIAQQIGFKTNELVWVKHD